MIDEITWKDRENKDGFSRDMWEKRIKLMSEMIDDEISSVLDLCAGGMLLRQYLEPSVEYYPVDYESRCDETIVCDFNNYEFPKLDVDLVFVSGCLEYVKDVDWFINNITNAAKSEILISYCALDFISDISVRRKNAWINDVTISELIYKIQNQGFILTNRNDYFKHCPILKFEKINSKILEKNYLCSGCNACRDICPTNSISMKLDKNGFRFPYIDENICINCGKCYGVCPTLNTIHHNTELMASFVIAASDRIRYMSSSGGMFTLVAEYILSQGGVCCGATLENGQSVKHIIINDIKKLHLLRGSKYIQSDMNGIYKEIKLCIEKGELVLFTGTPCQVAALYNFLGGDNPNLVTLDVLCHGVPSDKAVEMYLKEIAQGKEIVNIEFRPKEDGCNCNTIIIHFNDGTRYKADVQTDLFEQCYHYSLFLRESCGECSFSKFPRQGDLSIGDFHGIDECKEFENDNKGTSIVFINNDKGLKIFNAVKREMQLCKEVSVEFSKNNRINSHIDVHPSRERFFELLNKYSFHKSADYALKSKYDVGIIGIHTVENHGSNLSYYGLYKTLKDMGYETLMVERPASSSWAPHENPIIFKTNPYDLNDISPLYPNKQSMKDLNAQCDTFVLGSDQIWYYGLYDCFDRFCFLDYIHDNKKKIAYATSFGRDIYTGPDEMGAKVSYLLKRFDHISVREDSGVKLCEKEFNVNADVVLDPVFLCDVKHYYKLIENSSVDTSNKFIAAYVIDPSKEKENIINNISDRLNIKSINMTDVIGVEDKISQWSLETKVGVYNEDWLKYISDSDILITDSFHGTCFAIIFRKQFITIANEYRGLTRFEALLQKLGLMDRLIFRASDLDNVVEPIDYDAVYKILDQEKLRSLKWLKDAIDKNEKKELSTFDILDERIDEIDNIQAQYVSMVDDHGHVIGAHDVRLQNYDLNFQSIQEMTSQYASMIDAHGHVIGAHDLRLQNYDMTFQSIFQQLELCQKEIAQQKEIITQQKEIITQQKEIITQQGERLENLQHAIDKLKNSILYKVYNKIRKN